MIEILAAIAMLIGTIITIALAYRESQQICNRHVQRAKEIEKVRYHFWLREVGFEETAFMFNEFGISVSLGEEV